MPRAKGGRHVGLEDLTWEELLAYAKASDERATKAERERDEALEDARAARRERDEAIRTREEQDTEAQHRAVRYCKQKSEAGRERDEALAEVAKLKTFLIEIANVPDHCVLCGADTRQQKDCRSCGNVHMGSRQCFRHGEHDPECGLKPYETIRRKGGV